MGRNGYQEFGVPYAGVMDCYAAKMVNVLLGNEESAAVIEMTMMGPLLQFECSSLICISGAEMSPKINGESIRNNKVVQVQQGDILSFGKLKSGFRGYLGVLGGFQSEKVLNSRSMYKSITRTPVLQKDDVLPIENKSVKLLAKHARIKVDKNYFLSQELEVFKGPEFNRLSLIQQNTLLKNEFRISKENNRMAYQLEEPFNNELDAIITSAVMPGTVQLTPSGKLIVLMRDCQTTGGYPRVLQLSACAINALSQKFTGQIVQFKIIV